MTTPLTSMKFANPDESRPDNQASGENAPTSTPLACQPENQSSPLSHLHPGTTASFKRNVHYPVLPSFASIASVVQSDGAASTRHLPVTPADPHLAMHLAAARATAHPPPRMRASYTYPTTTSQVRTSSLASSHSTSTSGAHNRPATLTSSIASGASSESVPTPDSSSARHGLPWPPVHARSVRSSGRSVASAPAAPKASLEAGALQALNRLRPTHAPGDRAAATPLPLAQPSVAAGRVPAPGIPNDGHTANVGEEESTGDGGLSILAQVGGQPYVSPEEQERPFKQYRMWEDGVMMVFFFHPTAPRWRVQEALLPLSARLRGSSKSVFAELSEDYLDGRRMPASLAEHFKKIWEAYMDIFTFSQHDSLAFDFLDEARLLQDLARQIRQLGEQGVRISIHPWRFLIYVRESWYFWMRVSDMANHPATWTATTFHNRAISPLSTPLQIPARSAMPSRTRTQSSTPTQLHMPSRPHVPPPSMPQAPPPPKGAARKTVSSSAGGSAGARPPKHSRSVASGSVRAGPTPGQSESSDLSRATNSPADISVSTTAEVFCQSQHYHDSLLELRRQETEHNMRMREAEMEQLRRANELAMHLMQKSHDLTERENMQRMRLSEQETNQRMHLEEECLALTHVATQFGMMATQQQVMPPPGMNTIMGTQNLYSPPPGNQLSSSSLSPQPFQPNFVHMLNQACDTHRRLHRPATTASTSLPRTWALPIIERQLQLQLITSRSEQLYA
ncbi:hypothetical protein FRC06_007812 [Ceratobasidium sp. 370]|nr:hypothetical protein FRC06_007812 [Ceratobasidium sp. 370]